MNEFEFYYYGIGLYLNRIVGIFLKYFNMYLLKIFNSNSLYKYKNNILQNNYILVFFLFFNYLFEHS